MNGTYLILKIVIDLKNTSRMGCRGVIHRARLCIGKVGRDESCPYIGVHFSLSTRYSDSSI